MQFIDSRGDRYRLWVCPYPVKTGNDFEGCKVSAGWFVLLGDEPAKMFCAFQEGNKENVGIYSNIIV